MVSVLGVALLLVVLGFHTLLAAIMTRFFRIRLATNWGAAVYTAVFVPVALLASTLIVTGPLGIGVDLGSPTVVLATLVLAPTAVGAAVDVMYVEHPDEYDLPEPTE